MNEVEENKIRADEREIIARHLHDVLSNELLHFQYLFLKTEPALPPPLFSKLSNQLVFLRNQVRNLSHKITPPNVAPNCSLVVAVKELLIDYTYLFSDIAFDFILFPKNKEIILNQPRKNEVVLILKEIIHNAIEHGKAKEIGVNITDFNTYLSLIVTDNGVGFETSKTRTGIGLKNIEQRITKMNGLFILDSTPLRGTTITLEIPI